MIVGFIVIVFVPEPAIRELEDTSNDSKISSFELLKIIMFPVSVSTTSEKFKTILLSNKTDVESSLGDSEEIVGMSAIFLSSLSVFIPSLNCIFSISI